MKKILITGANSFIGTSLENYLKQWPDNYMVKTIDMIGDARKSEDFSGYDSVFHVAGIVHRKENKNNTDLYYKINRDLAIEIAEKAKKSGVRQFVFLSSMNVYGLDMGVITKDTSPKPTSHYGKSKLEAEMALEKLRSDSFKICVLRPPMVYGKNCKGNYLLLEKFALKYPFFPKIKNQRSIIYIDNLCEMIKQLIDESADGLFFPQNKEYICTNNAVTSIALANGRKIFSEPISGFIIKLFLGKIKILNKAFGSLIYQGTEERDFKYCVVDFKESLEKIYNDARPKKKNNQKDILFLCQFFHPEHISSAVLPFDTAKYLVNHGFSVDALCGYPKEYFSEANVPLFENADGVGIHRLKYLELSRKRKINRIINYFSFTAAAFLKRKMLKNYKCVIVYSNPPVLPIVPISANRRYGTKFVFVAYDVYPEVAYASKSLTSEGMIAGLMRKINHKLYTRVSWVISLTDEMKNFLLKERPELSEDRVTTIANWAHEEVTTPTSSAYKRFGYPDNHFIVSYFGNMGTCQDMETLLQAAELLKSDTRISFLIVGHGNKKDFVQNEIINKKLDNVQLLDFLTGEDFEQAVAISSCCLVSLEKGLMGTCAPSKYYSCIQGGSPVLAVVEKDSYLAAEVENEKIGHAVEIGDGQGLKNCILDLFENPAECIEMGKRAQALYENNYSYDISLKKYADVFKEILDK